MKPWSWRWWFENRETGDITIAQFPSWPLWGVAACWVVRLVTTSGSTLDGVVGWATRALWIVWALDELIRGVNPWRRILGAAVLAFQIAAIVTG